MEKSKSSSSSAPTSVRVRIDIEGQEPYDHTFTRMPRLDFGISYDIETVMGHAGPIGFNYTGKQNLVLKVTEFEEPEKR